MFAVTVIGNSVTPRFIAIILIVTAVTLSMPLRLVPPLSIEIAAGGVPLLRLVLSAIISLIPRIQVPDAGLEHFPLTRFLV